MPRQVFGYDAVRAPQRQIVEHLIAGGSALVLMPTSGGKSLCYQIPAHYRTGMAVLIYPLIALMQDQVEALLQAGVRAAALHSALSPEASTETWRALGLCERERPLALNLDEAELSPGTSLMICPIGCTPEPSPLACWSPSTTGLALPRSRSAPQPATSRRPGNCRSASSASG